jgi:FKBP12-rapamycin complex-associated protein
MSQATPTDRTRRASNIAKSWSDTLAKLTLDLKSKEEERRIRGAKELAKYVEEQSRELKSDLFNVFINDINNQIFELINSNSSQDKLGGVTAISELIEADFQEDIAKLSRLADYLRLALSTSTEPQIISLAAKTLGRLSRVEGTRTWTMEMCAAELKTWLDVLAEKERQEMKRHAAVTVLANLAVNAPSLFYLQLPRFLELVWVALRDPKLATRQTAAEALGTGLRLLVEREGSFQLIRQVYEETVRGLNKGGSLEIIHGSLIALGELLRNTRNFFTTVSRYQEAYQHILKYREHKDKFVRSTAISMLPRLAKANPEVFVKSFLDSVIHFLLSTLQHSSDAEKGVIFTAIGEISLAIRHNIKPYLDRIVAEIQATLKGKSKQCCDEALGCITMLARAVGIALHQGCGMKDLLNDIFSVRLSEPLVATLEALVTHIPTLLKEIQLRLMDVLSNILAKKPYIIRDETSTLSPSKSSSSLAKSKQLLSRKRSFNTPRTFTLASNKDVEEQEVIALALRTLGSFNLQGFITNLDEFLREIVVHYMDGENPLIRKEAAVACAQLLVRSEIAAAESATVTAPTHRRNTAEDIRSAALLALNTARAARLTSPLILAEVLERLLIVGVADPDPVIRETVLASLDPVLDVYLAQPENIRSLFSALNDEVFEIREKAIAIFGRLSVRNPAYILPPMRKILVQLLTELEFSGDSLNKEEAAKLLATFIHSAPQMFCPFASSIISALIHKVPVNLSEDYTKQAQTEKDPRVLLAVLSALSEIALVSPQQVGQYIDRLLPFLVHCLQYQTAPFKRELALRVLGQLARHTGYVVEPYERCPELLDILLHIVMTEKAKGVRREVIKVLGILGAIDPYKHKLVKQRRDKLDSLDAAATPRRKMTDRKDSVAQSFRRGTLPALQYAPVLSTSSENYYASVAIQSLVHILNDSALSTYHAKAISALISIVRDCLGGQNAEQFLPQIMPPLLQSMRSKDTSYWQFVLSELTTLVSIVKRPLANYLDEAFVLIQERWQSDLLPTILELVEETSDVLGDEFKVYLPSLLPRMLNVLHSDYSLNHELTKRILSALELIGPSLDDYLHLITPVLMKLLEQYSGVSAEVQLMAIRTLGRLCHMLSFAEHASQIVHPLARLLASDASPQLKNSALDVLCHLVYQAGPDYIIFIPMMNRILSEQQLNHSTYLTFISKLLKNETITESELPSIPESVRERRRSSPAERPGGEGLSKLKIDESKLHKAWAASNASTREDWVEWMRRLSVELIRESPQAPIRFCLEIAEEYYPLVTELFNAAFLSVWTALSRQSQEELIDCLMIAFKSPNVPADIMQMLLNLVEFLERARVSISIVELKDLSALAEKCHAYAKALHYKELEFQTSASQQNIEALIRLNTQLQQREAAEGMLVYAHEKLHLQSKESWLSKLHRWEDALQVYEMKLAGMGNTLSKEALNLKLGQLRCLHALGEWSRLYELCVTLWSMPKLDVNFKKQMASWAVVAAWHQAEWTQMEQFLSVMKIEESEEDGEESTTSALDTEKDDLSKEKSERKGHLSTRHNDAIDAHFFHAVLALHKKQFERAQHHIQKARDLIDAELIPLVSESYSRAYDVVVRIQQLAEMEEVMEYLMCDVRHGLPERREMIQEIWSRRLQNCAHRVETWQQILSVRSLVLHPKHDIDTWLSFAKICRKEEMPKQARKLFAVLLGPDVPLELSPKMTATATKMPNTSLTPTTLSFTQPHVTLQYIKLLWSEGQRQAAFDWLKKFVTTLPTTLPATTPSVTVSPRTTVPSNPSPTSAGVSTALLARCWLKLGEWQSILNESHFDSQNVSQILSALKKAIEFEPNWYKAWHAFAQMNFELVTLYEKARLTMEQLLPYVVSAIKSFFKAISLAPEQSLRDTLRLLTLWFNYGGKHQAVREALMEGFGFGESPTVAPSLSVSYASTSFPTNSKRSPQTSSSSSTALFLSPLRSSRREGRLISVWLQVIPQIIARMDVPDPAVREIIFDLLCAVGTAHPQALVYPLTLASKSQDENRCAMAKKVMDHMRQHTPHLLDQALLVSQELIRVAITWIELWYEGLDDASRLYFIDNNIEGMLQMLNTLHRSLNAGVETMMELAFVQAYGRDLQEASEWVHRYTLTHDEMCLNQAWDLYLQVFKQLSKQLPIMTSLHLHYASPKLLNARELDLAVPGTYKVDRPVIRIRHFHPQLTIITSKQRPRKIQIKGSDGVDYMFLLKGHEDLRQDERVMQLFGLVNTLLSNHRKTSSRQLRIKRYSVTPLSPDSGLLGWVPHCDTLHQLIKEYRTTAEPKIRMNLEIALMARFCGDYNNKDAYNALTLIQKIEAFKYALQATDGRDLAKVDI